MVQNGGVDIWSWKNQGAKEMGLALYSRKGEGRKVEDQERETRKHLSALSTREEEDSRLTGS